jgi:hypothetical protein
MTILFTIYLYFAVGLFLNKKTCIIVFLVLFFFLNKAIKVYKQGVQFGGKNVQHPKKSIFNDWSVSENHFNIVFYNKIYTIKNVSCWKKITGWIVLQYKIIITQYLNIATCI